MDSKLYLNGYGTGAIMGVPAHDDRDKEFATKYGIEIIESTTLQRFINSYPLSHICILYVVD